MTDESAPAAHGVGVEMVELLAAIADWEADVQEVLHAVEQHLAPFGLKVVMSDAGPDRYVWTIERITEGTA